MVLVLVQVYKTITLLDKMFSCSKSGLLCTPQKPVLKQIGRRSEQMHELPVGWWCALHQLKGALVGMVVFVHVQGECAIFLKHYS
eukprot:SAG31_NODE_7594_length_1645_cov_1.831177_2_plen_85_part_00